MSYEVVCCTIEPFLIVLQVGTSPATGQEMEWEETWNTMEPFSVTVVPSDPSDQSDRDLFQDMQPVLKKMKKVATPCLYLIPAW